MTLPLSELLSWMATHGAQLSIDSGRSSDGKLQIHLAIYHGGTLIHEAREVLPNENLENHINDMVGKINARAEEKDPKQTVEEAARKGFYQGNRS